MTYKEWYTLYSNLTGMDKLLISQHVERFKYKPLLSLLTPVYNTKEVWLRKCIESVLEQIYQNWELCLCDNGSEPSTSKILQEYAKKDSRIKIIRVNPNRGGYGGTNAALDSSTGDYIGFLDSDDEITPHALYLVAEKLNRHADANWIYTDEVIVDSNGAMLAPFFKPDFCPELMLSQFYMSHLSLYEAKLIKKLRLRESAGSHDYDLALRVIEIIPKNTIYHIPVMVYKYRKHDESLAANTESYCIEGAMKSVQEHLERIGRRATLYINWPHYRVKYHLDSFPHVDILIASRNKDGILFNCINNLLYKTDYPDYSICLSVTKDVKLATAKKYSALVASDKIKFSERAESTSFNYSLLANNMNKVCSGPILCFLNDDTDPLNATWLEEMVSHAVHPETGAVGARLLYPDLTIQHCGCILGIRGTCDHVFKRKPMNWEGYFGRNKLTGNYCMVTGACLMMRKEVYEEIGGYNEEFQVAYGDVDICLRIIKAGYNIVYTPYASLLHLEAFTRGIDDTPEKLKLLIKETELLREKWKWLLDYDPCYNPNLSLTTINFDMLEPQYSRYKKPWLR